MLIARTPVRISFRAGGPTVDALEGERLAEFGRLLDASWMQRNIV
ncbi:MAG TPA: hypothetical protein VNL77_07955 [Roseiflexaceae bacterium]|nr:hypothetical protein [Roseiflexaceae bacterium]